MIFNHNLEIRLTFEEEYAAVQFIHTKKNVHLQHYTELFPECSHHISLKQSTSMFFSHYREKKSTNNYCKFQSIQSPEATRIT